MKKVYYNVTNNIDETIEYEWLSWMKQDYIPELLSGEYFESIKLLKVLVEEEMGGQTYAIMHKCKNIEVLEDYVQNHSHKLNKIMSDKFGQKVVSFVTLLEEEYTI